MRAALHEHLDGCLHPRTLLELASRKGVSLGVGDEDALRAMLKERAQGSLEAYLSTFRLTVGVLEDEQSLERVAYEHIEQLLDEGVGVAEIRFAPKIVGPSMHRAIEAVWRGMERGMAGTSMRGGIIVCAMREEGPEGSLEVARVASYLRGAVVGFDLAGMERGHRASKHQSAIETALEAGLGLALHAGEADGIESVRDAMEMGAVRLGHGVALGRGLRRSEETGEYVLSETAQMALDRGVVLEVCVSSNVDTRAVESVESHPVVDLIRAGFRVSLQTDNRLMSGVTMGYEEALVRGLGASEEEILQSRAAGLSATFVR